MAPEDKFDWARLATNASPSCLNIVETCFFNYTEKGYAEIMYAPGRMVHLKRTLQYPSYTHEGDGLKNRKKAVKGFEAVWISKDDLASGGHLALSVLFPGAVTDHFPWYMIDAFNHILKRKN